jgi:hypothetical protein
MKLLILAFALFLLPLLNATAHGQCWSLDGPQHSLASPAASTSVTGAIIAEMSAVMQRRLDWAGTVLLIDAGSASVEIDSETLYIGSQLFESLESTHQVFIEKSHLNPSPSGLKLLIVHQYAHRFQFQAQQKLNSPLTPPTAIDELQADVLSAFLIASMLDLEYATLSSRDRSTRILSEIELAMLVASQMPNSAFIGLNASSVKVIRKACLQLGYKTAREKKFGPLKEAIRQRDLEIYEWSRRVAESIMKDHTRTLPY